MKGIILSEFVEFLEQHYGEDDAQQIIDDSGVASLGAYSRVGKYDYQELISLLVQAAAQTNTDPEILLAKFSEHLFAMFRRNYGTFFEGVDNAAQMLMQIDNHIHVEVIKLYPDAELPKFEYNDDGGQLTLRYQSPRPLAQVAHALVNACLAYFDGKERLLSADISDDYKSAVFVIG